MQKTEFLGYLSVEFQEYCQIPSEDIQEKQEKKQFINGLMKAARIFGVSFDELTAVVKSEQPDAGPSFSVSSPEDIIKVPAYIRHGIDITY
ncbi:hypothetical protein [Oceanisphaera arctica]|uniref:Uncharacterized protein n=1 Tax=Oceanisphaera arctica TaxID=641510 RepID=A0A2P5TKW5_9GAMM|nr:hypothetical protein [Oceanisphaera arctica]PPL15851.1 hypothetical protein UN63_11230 [Oceanisphaera arctica]GHA10779.1 hypothetical protein GCM10007082_09690 [Oceanisphaera arctica]